MSLEQTAPTIGTWVPETDFGKWFLGTETWKIQVLERAVTDLQRLIPNRRPSYPVVLDVGCGCGLSFQLLHERFAPGKIIGVDVCSEMLEAARVASKRIGVPVDLHRADCVALPLADESVDLVFCHQTFHHLVAQEDALKEFHRVLRRGGLLLFAESTREYICSWIIRLLFRHPMEVQRDASTYIDMVRRAGFDVGDGEISYPYLWWSRPDIGLKERFLRIKPAKNHPETLVNLVGIRT
jgi:ubiquinone/menaquinone biosynthesis C-methylase UbiE